MWADTDCFIFYFSLSYYPLDLCHFSELFLHVGFLLCSLTSCSWRYFSLCAFALNWQGYLPPSADELSFIFMSERDGQDSSLSFFFLYIYRD